MDEFASPILKLGRAYEHYTAFDEKFSAFKEANPYTTYREREPKSGFEVLKLKLIGRPRPDPRWGTIIGDFASNLRGALDHLVWAMSIAPKEPHKVEFPIEGEPRTLAEFKRTQARRIGAIPDEAQDIIEGQQPYKRYGSLGEHELWRIKCLANADKHRTVTLITSGLHHQFRSALFESSAWFFSFPDDAQEDPVIPDQRRQSMQPWYQHTHGDFNVRPAFAVVTTEGLSVPVEHLLGLYEFVRDKVFPSFPERFFPK